MLSTLLEKFLNFKVNRSINSYDNWLYTTLFTAASFCFYILILYHHIFSPCILLDKRSDILWHVLYISPRFDMCQAHRVCELYEKNFSLEKRHMINVICMVMLFNLSISSTMSNIVNISHSQMRSKRRGGNFPRASGFRRPSDEKRKQIKRVECCKLCTCVAEKGSRSLIVPQTP